MKKIYILICNCYNILFTILEKILYLKIKITKQSNLNSTGFEIIKIQNNAEVYEPEKIIKSNPYITKDIIKKEDIDKYINFLFIKNDLKKIISDKTGYYFSIDYIISYTTFNIPKSEIDKEIYANQWHLDKPFSKNTLKIIVPLNFQNYYNGGIKIFNFDQTKLIKKNSSVFSTEKSFEMENKTGEILLFYPNLCFHKAGNPRLAEGRKQIMLQLNPSKKWCLNDNIYQKQYKIEPKFPFFNYITDKKTLI